MATRDYNGSGRWTAEAIAERYEELCRGFGLSPERKLQPQVHSDGTDTWIYPMMEAVVDGIRKHDPACIAIGIDFICQSASFPFGMTLKSQTARALKSAPLTTEQLDIVRSRVAGMLLEGYVPQEYRFYARLLRRTGLGHFRQPLLSLQPRGHRMERYCNYVRLLAAESDA